MACFVSNIFSTRQTLSKDAAIYSYFYTSKLSSRTLINMNSNDLSNFQTPFDMLYTSTPARPADVIPTIQFEPILPEPSTVAGFLTTLILCVIAGWVWSNQVVPISRTKLAISKRSGAVREYLDQLSDSGEKLPGEEESESSHFKDSALNSSMISAATSESTSSIIDNNSLSFQKEKKDRSFERWLFSDWLEKGGRRGQPGRQKEPALPILKKAKWNSGDNPVLAATALIMLGVLFTSITERIFIT
jgi:hypothetical protein